MTSFEQSLPEQASPLHRRGCLPLARLPADPPRLAVLSAALPAALSLQQSRQAEGRLPQRACSAAACNAELCSWSVPWYPCAHSHELPAQCVRPLMCIPPSPLALSAHTCRRAHTAPPHRALHGAAGGARRARVPPLLGRRRALRAVPVSPQRKLSQTAPAVAYANACRLRWSRPMTTLEPKLSACRKHPEQYKSLVRSFSEVRVLLPCIPHVHPCVVHVGAYGFTCAHMGAPPVFRCRAARTCMPTSADPRLRAARLAAAALPARPHAPGELDLARDALQRWIQLRGQRSSAA